MGHTRQPLLRWSRTLSAVEIKAVNVGTCNNRNDESGGPTLCLPLVNVNRVMNILSHVTLSTKTHPYHWSCGSLRNVL